MGRGFKKEGTYVYLRLIHADVWQKSSQYCKVIIFQLKIKLKKKNYLLGLPWWSVVKNLPANVGDTGSIPGLGRFHMPWGN